MALELRHVNGRMWQPGQSEIRMAAPVNRWVLERSKIHRDHIPWRETTMATIAMTAEIIAR